MTLKEEIVDITKRFVNLVILYLGLYPIAFLIVILFSHHGLFPVKDHVMMTICITIGLSYGTWLIYCDKKKKFRVWK